MSVNIRPYSFLTKTVYGNWKKYIRFSNLIKSSCKRAKFWTGVFVYTTKQVSEKVRMSVKIRQILIVIKKKYICS